MSLLYEGTINKLRNYVQVNAPANKDLGGIQRGKVRTTINRKKMAVKMAER